jgi:hypothetical protein
VRRQFRKEVNPMRIKTTIKAGGVVLGDGVILGD